MPEIIFEILLKLPVESLLRIRSVCKLWCSIISDSHFIKSHLSLSSSNNLYAHHQFIFTTQTTIYRKSYIKSCRFYDVLHDGSVKALELDYPLKHPLKFVCIAGSCNGLLLIKNADKVVFIWNPITRKSKRLPDFGYKRCLYGFGYDKNNDDYKVFGISGGEIDTIVKLYSLNTGNLKRIGYNSYPRDATVTYLNGALHWVAGRKSGSSHKLTIVSLDLATETYGEIMQPVFDESYKDMKVGAFGEYLAVLCDYHLRDYADLWVMKVYGVKDSWTKLVSIPYGDDPVDQFEVALGISNDGKILFKMGFFSGSKLVVYDSKNFSFSKIRNLNNAYTFVESLVSPTGTKDNY